MINILPTTPHSTNLGLSFMHAQLYPSFDTLHVNFHDCHFDNFYMSAKFTYTTFTHHPDNIKVQGVLHVVEQWDPMEVLHHEVKYKNPT